MHKKAVGIICLLCFLVFGHSLWNDFVGDDTSFILENHFYQKWSNLRYLISPQYITESDDVFNRNQAAVMTGSVAYRPVLSLTYFIDSWVWGVNPFGFHLTNLFLHLMNSLLVYFCVWSLFRQCFKGKESNPWEISLLSAIIFCVHPLKTEPVCSIGYRADLLASFFVFFAFLLYVNTAKSSGWHKTGKIIFAHLFFFLGLLSKEAVIVFPFIIISLDWVLKQLTVKQIFSFRLRKYSGYFLILFFYLILYFKIVPNSSLMSSGFLGGSLLNHVILMVYFLSQYLLAIIFPFMVKILPPVYIPSIKMIMGGKACLAIFVVLLFVFLCFFILKKRDKVSFFLLWFLLGLIPILNIIPIVNPFAYRFMYFPSLGFSVLIALIFLKSKSLTYKDPLKARISKMVKLSFIAICIIVTFFSVFAWRNNFIMAQNMIKDFPDNPVGYLMLSIQYEQKRLLSNACEMAEKSLELGIKDPRAYHVLGLCNQKDREKSKFYFNQCRVQFPRYSACLVGLGRISLLEGNVLEAKHYLAKGLELSPSFSGYVYLLQAVLLKGEVKKADEIYRDAISWFSDKREISLLNNIYVQYEKKQLPYDYGF